MGKLDETKVLEKDPTLKGQDLPKDDESNSKDTPKNYTEKEYLKGIEDAIAQYGDRIKREKIDPITQERDTFKANADKVTIHEARIADLEADLEEAIGEDANLLDINKIRKDSRTKRDDLLLEHQTKMDNLAELTKTLESDREEWAGTVVAAQAFKFDGELVKVVDEYDGDVTANFTKLKTACDKAGVKTKEGAEAIAETFMAKKVIEPDLLSDSGTNNGGTEKLGDMPIADQIKILNERALKKIKV